MKQFVLVGHCAMDRFQLKRTVKRALGNTATTAHVNDTAKLDKAINPDSVLLINRQLDGRFDTLNGIELIGQLNQHDNPPAMLLISNFPDAQQQAVQAGALPGFGKSQLHEPATAVILKSAAADPA